MTLYRCITTLIAAGTAFCLGALAAPSSRADSLPAVTPVSFVDLTRYAGSWYEIAKIPNRFQKACASDTTADYTLRDDGLIDVVNSCTKANGDRDEARGLAKIADKTTNAKLQVSFVSFFGWRPFWGDYWVIDLDENYDWAVVGHPSRKYGWILSRKPVLDEQALEQAFASIENNGYQRGVFEWTLQSRTTVGNHPAGNAF